MSKFRNTRWSFKKEAEDVKVPGIERENMQGGKKA